MYSSERVNKVYHTLYYLTLRVHKSNVHPNQSIKTNLYRAMHRKRIRGAYWQTPLGKLFTFTICNIEQFSC